MRRLDDVAVMEDLDPAKCRRLMATQGIGRVALVADGEPAVLPVGLALIGEVVVFRTALGSTFDMLGSRHRGRLRGRLVRPRLPLGVERRRTRDRGGWRGGDSRCSSASPSPTDPLKGCWDSRGSVLPAHCGQSLQPLGDPASQATSDELVMPTPGVPAAHPSVPGCDGARTADRLRHGGTSAIGHGPEPLMSTSKSPLPTRRSARTRESRLRRHTLGARCHRTCPTRRQSR